MTKLCPRGKAAAKRKFKVYPSAYANAYASKICAGKIKDPSGVKRKDFRGPKPMNKGGGADTGTRGELKSQLNTTAQSIARKIKNKDKLTLRDQQAAKLISTNNPRFKALNVGKRAISILKDAKKKVGGMTAGSQSAMGRLQKARMMNKGGGADLAKDPTKPVNPFLKRRKKLSGGKALGKVVGRLGLAGAAAVAGATAVKKMMDKKKVDKKKMGGLKAELNNPAKGYMAGGMADYYKDLM